MLGYKENTNPAPVNIIQYITGGKRKSNNLESKTKSLCFSHQENIQQSNRNVSKQIIKIIYSHSANGKVGIYEQIKATIKTESVNHSAFLHAEKMAPSDIHQRLLNVCRDQTVDVSTLRWWVVHFSKLASDGDQAEKQCFVTENLFYQIVSLCSL